ncbi:MAG: RidA family protein [Acidimicrobiales bacterium]
MKLEIVQRGPEPSSTAPYLSDAVRAGPYVFASGLLVPTERTGSPYDSPIKAQTELALRGLAESLEAGGSSLGQAVKLGSFHTDLDELPAHLEVRRQLFSDPGPPSTALGCGLVREGAVIEVDVVGLVAASGADREVIFSDRVPRPVAPYAQAIKAGPLVFVAGTMATDFRTGIVAEARVPEGLPWFGSPIRRQTEWVLGAIGDVLEAAGSSLDQVVKAQVILTDMSDLFGLDEVWRAFFGAAPPARTVVEGGLVNPGCLVEVDVVAIAPESGWQKEVVVTDRAPMPTVCQSQAVRAGDFVFTSGLLPTDFATGLAPEVRIDPRFPRYGSAIKKQVSFVLGNLEEILRASGSDLSGVARVGAFHTALARDLLGAMEVRRERFGSSPPASTTIEVSRLAVPGSLFMLDAVAVTTS